MGFEHPPCVQEVASDLPVLDPVRESLPAREPVESNTEEPATEYLHEWKPVGGESDEPVGLETCVDEPESGCTEPDVSVEQRPEPEQSSKSLNEHPTQLIKTVPISSELGSGGRNLISN